MPVFANSVEFYEGILKFEGAPILTELEKDIKIVV
jgi:hypothetical protein